MSNNITADDRNAVIEFLKTDPILTNGPKVREFEEAWSKWLGVKYSVFVNSGASANLITWAYWQHEGPRIYETDITVPTLTWVSDIASLLQNGFNPHFVDIDKDTLGAKIDKSGVVFLTHVMGFPARLYDTPKEYLVEDCCEAHGATIDGKKVGTFGVISNFSFYFAHHMSTIEGGMVCTDDKNIYEKIRMFRSHGMVREMTDPALKEEMHARYPSVHHSFMFAYPGYNVRSTEIGAVLGLNQLKRLDENNEKRKVNSEIFFSELNPKLYRTNLKREGAVPYALVLILNEPSIALRDSIEELLAQCCVEYRRGLSGGGNQLRQPYLRHIKWRKEDFPEVEHITDFSWYIGNYPDLDHSKIRDLCKLLNQF